MHFCLALLFAALNWSTQDRAAAIDRVEAALGNYLEIDKVPAIRAAVEKQRALLLAADTQKAFADSVTVVLQQASNDKHFILWYSDRADPNRTNDETPAEKAEEAKFFRYGAQGHQVTARLRANVGYLRLAGFANMPDAKAMLDSTMRILADTDVLIIDMRDNHGGDSDTVDYLLGYFLEKPTVIADITQRVNGKFITSQESSAATVSGPRYLNKPLYVLTGPVTISAGEFFAYSLQSVHRATVIGEKSAGAANGLGSPPVYITDHLRLSVPDTRMVNPVTQSNWEKGVSPDIQSAVDRALLVAYTKALQQVPSAYDPFDELKEALAHPAQALHDSFPSGI